MISPPQESLNGIQPTTMNARTFHNMLLEIYFYLESKSPRDEIDEDFLKFFKLIFNPSKCLFTGSSVLLDRVNSKKSGNDCDFFIVDTTENRIIIRYALNNFYEIIARYSSFSSATKNNDILPFNFINRVEINNNPYEIGFTKFFYKLTTLKESFYVSKDFQNFVININIIFLEAFSQSFRQELAEKSIFPYSSSRLNPKFNLVNKNKQPYVNLLLSIEKLFYFVMNDSFSKDWQETQLFKCLKNVSNLINSPAYFVLLTFDFEELKYYLPFEKNAIAKNIADFLVEEIIKTLMYYVVFDGKYYKENEKNDLIKTHPMRLRVILKELITDVNDYLKTKAENFYEVNSNKLHLNKLIIPRIIANLNIPYIYESLDYIKDYEIMQAFELFIKLSKRILKYTKEYGFEFIDDSSVLASLQVIAYYPIFRNEEDIMYLQSLIQKSALFSKMERLDKHTAFMKIINECQKNKIRFIEKEANG
jgi:hypothetical protein